MLTGKARILSSSHQRGSQLSRSFEITLEFQPIETAPILDGEEFGPVWGKPGLYEPMVWIRWDGRHWCRVHSDRFEEPEFFAYQPEEG